MVKKLNGKARISLKKRLELERCTELNAIAEKFNLEIVSYEDNNKMFYDIVHINEQDKLPEGYYSVGYSSLDAIEKVLQSQIKDYFENKKKIPIKFSIGEIHQIQESMEYYLQELEKPAAGNPHQERSAKIARHYMAKKTIENALRNYRIYTRFKSSALYD